MLAGCGDSEDSSSTTASGHSANLYVGGPADRGSTAPRPTKLRAKTDQLGIEAVIAPTDRVTDVSLVETPKEVRIEVDVNPRPPSGDRLTNAKSVYIELPLSGPIGNRRIVNEHGYAHVMTERCLEQESNVC